MPGPLQKNYSVMVDVRFVEKFDMQIPLKVLHNVKGLEKMELLRKGSRLPVMPVSEQEFTIIMRLAGTRE